MKNSKDLPKYSNIWLKKNEPLEIDIKIVDALAYNLAMFSKNGEVRECFIFKVSKITQSTDKLPLQYNPIGDFAIMVTADSFEAKYFSHNIDNPFETKKINPNDYVDLPIKLEGENLNCLVHYKTVCEFKKKNLIKVGNETESPQKWIITFFSTSNTVSVKSNFWNLPNDEIKSRLRMTAIHMTTANHCSDYDISARKDSSFARIQLSWDEIWETPKVDSIIMACITDAEIVSICMTLVKAIAKGELNPNTMKDDEIWKLN